ncbi:hypothetical protein ACQJBY_022609 [Aegilops geniculata]
MLPLRMMIALLSMSLVVVSPAMGIPTDDKCKCLMCVCDLDPHPLPPAMPSHHPAHYPPEPRPEPKPKPEPEPEPQPEPRPEPKPKPQPEPQPEPEPEPQPEPKPEPKPQHCPPPPEPVPTPVYYYYPPPSEPEPTPVYYLPPPAEPYEYPYVQPAPVFGIVGTPGQMYPRDSMFNPSTAHRKLCRGISSIFLASSIVAAGLLTLLI